MAEPLLEPRLLLGTQDRLRWRAASRVGHAGIAEADFARRFAAVAGTAAIEDLHHVLGEHAEELLAAELAQGRIAEGVGAAIAVLVGEDQVEVAPVTERAIALEALDRRQVVRLDSQAVLVPLVDRDILDLGGSEGLERSARRSDTGRKVFEPGLVGGDLDALAGPSAVAGL